MAIHTFGAIDVGSYELGLKIYEISRGKGIRLVDHLERRVDLGSDTYETGKIRPSHVQEVTRILKEYKKIMEGYRCEAYQAYGTSAIREMENASLVLSQWEQQTGIHVDVLSNSEQRFLDYKSVASKSESFHKMIADTCAIVDIGGSSIQISLFDEQKLVATQNLRLGILRLNTRLAHIDARTSQIKDLVEELVKAQLETFQKLYLHQQKIHNIIVVDDYISTAMQSRHEEFLTADQFREIAERSTPVNRPELARTLGLTDDNLMLLYISIILMNCIVDNFGADRIWAPGVTLCDGIAYEYAERMRIIPPSHDFEADIIACAMSISKRYKGSMERSKTLELIALKIFDATKKIHGLGNRERLLLRLAAILHDCGKFISMSNLAECSYNIIMSTEMIGLSHIEREIVANVVLYNHEDFIYYEQQEEASDLDRGSYMTITKLTAILRLANGLDRSHKQKFDDMKISVRDERLLIQAKSGVDITLEKGLFTSRSDFFEEVLGLKPVIRQSERSGR